ncbi:anterior gradient protein 2 precursor [Xenopus laevis]|uniref:Anterior gradient protein 2 n=2 Tax=Xenopus laevis TaxID=8355 RepID=AG2_XENLA|nr:anterior gradient protein 2 precursor [Xenopus laevis]P55869.3 RecName: Full=Anterior gradient protein 2; Short=XAG-2; AltName: Full=Secreted protein np77; Flags: Precursor [Xenopus laevis]AAB81968.1 cement gland-specific [Xenopus laevis]AAH78083.1 LOC397989 protein [Xenopus laevis]OCT61240.1 hypothetical protein XELAEV_18047264mg [Xenopus laevis]
MQTGLSLACLVLLCSVLGEAALRKPKRQAGATDTNGAAKSEPAPVKTKGLKTLDRGWGEDIEWAQTYEEGLAKARENNKPLMVIHHLEDCPYSIALKKAFVADKMAQKLAQEDFIMLNLVHPVADENQSPDGHYVPRVIFIDPSLTVRSDLKGRYGNKLYAYDADDIPELITNMKKAKSFLKTEL